MSSHPHIMRPIEEKQVPVKVELMVWSKKMDLLALSYENGEVALHRLNWLKVWVLVPPEGVTVKGLAWRPDGKVIGVGYSNKEIKLIGVEHKDVLLETTVDGDITCMTWSDDLGDEDIFASLIEADMNNFFLPRLPELNRSSEEEQKSIKGVENQKSLNLLFVGLKTGQLLVSSFGLHPRVFINIAALLGIPECQILDAGCSKDQSIILVTVLCGNSIKIATIDTANIFSHYQTNILILSYKFGHVLSCMNYMYNTVQCIIESWENIMMEMDIKLRDYASKVPPGKVSCDFLELLMFGTPSSDMSEFLLESLTEKGLKKLNRTIEMSYINIQNLVLKHLQAVGQSFCFHFESLCGFARCPIYSSKIGLSESTIMTAFSATGSFLIKVAEVQHVIDESLKKYKVFFRWLYATFLRLNDERVVGDVCQMTPLELQQICDFLSGFEDDGRFNLEQLGQYLKSTELQDPPPPAETWATLLTKHPSLANLPYVIQHNTKSSLVLEITQLRDLARQVFTDCEKALEKHFTLKNMTEVSMPFIDPEKPPKVTHSFLQEYNKFTVALTDSTRHEGYHFAEMSIMEDAPYHTFINTPKKVVDVQFYLPEVLSLLFDMGPDADAGFAQVPYPLTGEHCSIRAIEGMVPSKFAVCGTRKVAVVLSESRQKVKIFEMDIEEEDDDEGMDTTNSTLRETDDNLS